jgi:hypothetical protein
MYLHCYVFSRLATLHSIRVIDFDNYLALIRYQCGGHTIILPDRIQAYLGYCVTVKLRTPTTNSCPQCHSSWMWPIKMLLPHNIVPIYVDKIANTRATNAYITRPRARVRADTMNH